MTPVTSAISWQDKALKVHKGPLTLKGPFSSGKESYCDHGLAGHQSLHEHPMLAIALRKFDRHQTMAIDDNRENLERLPGIWEKTRKTSQMLSCRV